MAASSATLRLLLALLLVLLCVAGSTRGARTFADDALKRGADVVRVELLHRDAPGSPLYDASLAHTERLKRRVQRSRARMHQLSAQTGHVVAEEAATSASASASATTSVHAGDGEFLMAIGIGTPPLSYVAILDTGSDLTWTQCQPCSYCYRQSTKVYDPATSSTFRELACSNSLCRALPEHGCSGTSACEYSYTYGDYSSTNGILGWETLWLGSTSAANVAFGCGEDNEGSGFQQAAGLVGMGWGPLSLASQLAPTFGSTFSYCLTSTGSSKTSPLLVGGGGGVKSGMVSTALIRNSLHPTFYYVAVDGLSVGNGRVAMPREALALKSDGSGGLIIDSGTTVTYLEQAAYSAVRDQLVAALRLPLAATSSLGLDTCFVTSSTVGFPELTVHFGGGADMVLPPENYIMRDSAGVMCLAMLPSNGLSILGNVQQQNFHIVYDTNANLLHFSPTQCDAL